MLEADKGLYCLGLDAGYRLGVDLTPTRLTLVSFVPAVPEDSLPEIALEALAGEILTGAADGGMARQDRMGFAIEDPDEEGTYLAYRSHMTFDLEDLRGADEIVDYSRFEVPIGDDGGLGTWDNRLITSRWDKNEYGKRNRAKRGAGIACYIWMPLATGSFADTRMIFPAAGGFGFGGGAFQPVALSLEAAPSDNRGYLRSYWSVFSPADLSVRPDGWVDIPIQLVENADGSDLAYATRLKLEALSGYLPQMRITTDEQGQAVIRACALGLTVGETLSLKINTEHYSSVGRIDLAVA